MNEDIFYLLRELQGRDLFDGFSIKKMGDNVVLLPFSTPEDMVNFFIGNMAFFERNGIKSKVIERTMLIWKPKEE